MAVSQSPLTEKSTPSQPTKLGFWGSLWANPRSIQGWFVTIGCFGFLFTCLFIKIPPENKDIIQLAEGSILVTLASVVQFYFGSSKDKADADKATRDNIAKDPPSTPAT